MPSMSMVEQGFCRSAAWRDFTERVILPWAVAEVELTGDVLGLCGGSGFMAEGMSRPYPQARITVTDIDPAMVRGAAKRLAQRENAAARKADVTALPSTDEVRNQISRCGGRHHLDPN